MKTLLTIAALLTASQAQALSCMRPDAAASFDQASASEFPYLVLTGTLTAPPASGTTESKPVSLLGTLTGQGLTADGFTAPLTATSSCRSPARVHGAAARQHQARSLPLPGSTGKPR